MPRWLLVSFIVVAVVCWSPPPLLPCVFLSCPTISRADALLGLVLKLTKPGKSFSKYTRAPAQDAQLARLRDLEATQMAIIGRVFQFFETADLAVNVRYEMTPFNISVAILTKASTASQRKPLIVMFHGGGMVIGKAVDVVSTSFAATSNAVIVSPDYRLAPEHPFPAGIEDCYATLLWAVENAQRLNIDPARVSLAGLSAGGLITASVTHLVRARGGPRLKSVFVGVPMLTPAMTDSKLAWWDDHDGLTAKDVAWFWQMYLANVITNEACIADPACSPLAATDFSHFPPTVILLGKHDVLYSEGLAMARALERAHVPTKIIDIRGSHFAIAFEQGVEQINQAWTPML